MSIATDVSRIKGNITAALSAIADKGVTVPDGSTSDALASLIASIEAGGGGGKVACGTFRLSEAASNITIEHGLGVVPNLYALVQDISYGRTKYTIYCSVYVPGYSCNGFYWGSSTTSLLFGRAAIDYSGPAQTRETESDYDNKNVAAAFNATEESVMFGKISGSYMLSSYPYYWILGRVE